VKQPERCRRGKPTWRELISRARAEFTAFPAETQKPVAGRSLDLVVRYSRMGERVPVDTDTLCRNVNSEFNSPFEEVSLVMELRTGQFGPPTLRIHTKKPLAIYVPAERLAIWQTGRSEDKFAARQARHPDFPLDIERQYIVIYGWIDGHDAEQTADLQGMTGGERSAFLAAITERAERELELKGFRVMDMKPAHVILRQRPSGRLLRRRDGRLAYAVVDYELLERTAAHIAWRSRSGESSCAALSSAPFLSAGALNPKL
jgi:hypothetical protein